MDIIVRSGEHLLNLINNVLDMAKIESGRVALKESEVDLNQLLHEMQSLMGVGAVEKGLRFALERDPDLPRFVAVDAGKLRQVLLNLLGNAIKYTDSGGVKLRARLASIHGSEEAKVRFEVEDSGPGISQEDCERIFFPFVQLGDQAPAQAGTGLGLAICKQYVELMGGQIGVTSKPGKGSVFYFEIPVRVLPSVAERDELKNPRILGLAEGQPRYRLLIVEDQPENRLLLRRLLEPLGFELREAANGQEAVALFEQWHPDLIWMDIRMPVMDGLEAVRRIRATKAGADTKIIALTAHALEEEREPIMAAGCDDLVRKPIREQELFGALARHLRLKFIYEKAPRQESTPEAPGLTLRPEQLDALPAELLQDLRQAVVELDTARTHALIEQVTERDASLGRALNTLATQLGYKRLLKLLKKGISNRTDLMSEDKKPTSTREEILVVDDTPASLRLLTELLTRHGYHVRPAEDGALALESVAAKTPDLILLDVSMPGMDGYEVCRRLKADEKSSRIPVIFISAFGDTRQKVTGFEAGGIDYITKPFEAEEVLARVRTHLRLRQAEEALRNAHNTLELRVQERTAELQASNQALRESEEKARRAFEEIEVLKSQLELHNTYLQEEVVEAKAFGDLVGQSAACGTLSARLTWWPPRKLRCSFWVRPEQAKNWWPMKSTGVALAKTARWFESIAPPFHGSYSKASSLAMCEALSPEP